jgi:nitrate/TMAO reductase-like tetraheme cytochrome c subunit
MSSAALCVVLVLTAAADTDERLLGDIGDGSRSVAVHRIVLFDEEDGKISPDDDPVLPFSVGKTCGACHSYKTVSKGWHFNAADPNVASGRPGEPWILVDAGTGTQIPLSYRRWPGTFKPEKLGLTSWQFTLLFGRHTPGGGAGELASKVPEEIVRQMVSGKLGINCLLCHNAHPGQDQAEYAAQIAKQNLRWAAVGACEFASIKGIAARQPDTYDFLMDDAVATTYREGTFDSAKQVLFDVGREVPDERCYYCHSSVNVDEEGTEKWRADEDVHLTAGMTCVDCHREGVEHDTIRGYEGEVSTNQLAAKTSCKGCHLGEGPSPVAGRLGAPVPEHPGIPPVHFEKLTCTACHSGPWPGPRTYRVKTSRAHGLGTHGVNKAAEALPHIMFPVFAEEQGVVWIRRTVGRAASGKIAPHKLVWPAFWGTLKGQEVAPIALDVARETVGTILAKKELPRSGNWPPLEVEDIAEGLKALQKETKDKCVYVCGGKLYRLDDSGSLSVDKGHPAARPYLWPLAHNVRPAAQALGIRRCEDCHATDAPFFFGAVAVDSPIAAQQDSDKKMVEFQDVDATYAWAFAFSFVFRPWLKVVALGCCGLIGVVLLLYGLRALACVAKVFAEED